MAWKMPRGSEARAAASSRRLLQERQHKHEKDLVKMQEKPWYEKYLLDPLVDIGTTVAGGWVGEMISPAKAAATAASKAATEASKARTESTKFATGVAKTKETDRLLTDAVGAMRNANPNITSLEIEERLSGDPELWKRWLQGSTWRNR